MVWRLIHNYSNVLEIFETNDITLTPYTIYDAATQDECFDKIDELSLVYYYPLNENEILLFSGGTRTIIQANNN